MSGLHHYIHIHIHFVIWSMFFNSWKTYISSTKKIESWSTPSLILSVYTPWLKTLRQPWEHRQMDGQANGQMDNTKCISSSLGKGDTHQASHKHCAQHKLHSYKIVSFKVNPVSRLLSISLLCICLFQS